MRLRVTRHELAYASLVAAGLAVLMSLPYLLGYTMSGPNQVYTGLVMNPEDSQSYFAKMLQGYQGRWLYSIPFTPEQHAPAFLGGFYIALGHLARVSGFSIEATWHGARLATDTVLFLVTFAFVASFLDRPKERWGAFLLALLGSGQGWLLLMLGLPDWLGAFPVDFKMPEAHLFFTALTFPHVAFGTALLIVSFWLTLRVTSARGHWRLVLIAGLVNGALAVIYPYLVLLVIATVSLHWLYQTGRHRRICWKETGQLAVMVLIPAPLLLYYAYILQVSVVFKAWSAQAITRSPPWPHYLVSYGIMLLLGMLPLLRRRKMAGPDRRQLNFLWLWVVTAAVLVYAPVNPQRRFVQGVQVPLAILSIVGLMRVVMPAVEQSRAFRWLVARPRYTTKGLRQLSLIGFLAFMSLSNVYLLADLSYSMAIAQPYPFFRDRGEQAAMRWVQTNVDSSAVVLGAYETGNYVAARAGNRVVLGHWAETLDWPRKMEDAQRFYDASTSDTWRRGFLARYQVQYVWHGPQERRLGQFQPYGVDYLQAVYFNDEVALYAVRQ